MKGIRESNRFFINMARLINRDYYMGFSLSPDLSARDSNIGPRACPRSDIGRGLIDQVMTKTPCYDMFQGSR